MAADARRALDHEILSRYLPGFVEHETDGVRSVDGTLTVQLAEAEPRAIPIRLQFGPSYAASEPIVLDAAGTFEHIANRHFMGSQACLWFMVETPWDPANPRALEPFLDQVAVFFVRQVLFDAGYGWLGGERAHGWEAGREAVPEMLGVGREGVADYVDAFMGKLREDRPCPCDGGRPYWVCHREAVLKILARFPGQQLAELVGGMWIETRVRRIGERFFVLLEGRPAAVITDCERT